MSVVHHASLRIKFARGGTARLVAFEQKFRARDERAAVDERRE